MKAILFNVAAAALVVGTSANAGGYIAPIETPIEPVIVEAVAPANWTGGYAGGTLGYAFRGDDEVGISTPNGLTTVTPGTFEANGFNYGVRAGYRKQFSGASRDYVVGAELGYEGGDIGDDFSTRGYDASLDLKNVLALRVKTGVLNKSENMLYYGILGVARGDFDYRVNGAGGAGAVAINDNVKETGYVVGFGVERMLSERMSVTGEYEYANFGKTTLVDAAGASTRATPDFHNVKVGLNFRF